MPKHFILKVVSFLVFPLIFFLFGFTSKEVESEQGLYLIDIEMQGQMKVGNNDLKLHIIDNKNMQPIESAVIEVASWMPTHDHGTKVAPVIKLLGNGNYLVEMLNFTMPGAWEIYFRINSSNSEDSVVIEVPVVGNMGGENMGGNKMDNSMK